ncbi:MAG: hypothetical protein ABJI69_09210 [Balneola sp.]
MPFNDKTTLTAHLRESFLTALFDDLDGEEIELALDQSASIVQNKTGADIPDDPSTSDKLLQLCDAWIFAWFATDQIEGLENELLTLVDKKYREVMGYLKEWKVNTERNKEESTIKSESNRTNWFTDVSGVLG